MPYRAQIARGVKKAVPWVASGTTIAGGGIVNQAASGPATAASQAQGWAGIVIAAIGLGSLALHFLTHAIGPYFANEKDKRDLERQKLRVEEAVKTAEQAKADVAAARADAERARAEAKAEADRLKAEAATAKAEAVGAKDQLQHVVAEVAANTARTFGLQGAQEGTLELLDDLAKRGIFAKPLRPERPGRTRPRSTVLVVEDDPDNARALMKLLTMQGYSPTHSPTIADATDKLALFPHFVILDLNVGDADGLALLRKVHDDEIPTRVVILAGVIPPEVAAEAKALGCGCLLTKGSSQFDELLACLKPETSGEESHA